MSQQTFRIRAVWDKEAGVYVSDSDIIGLHVEAADLRTFEELVLEYAPDLVLTNHLSVADFVTRPLRDLLPTIVFERPLAQAS